MIIFKKNHNPDKAPLLEKNWDKELLKLLSTDSVDGSTIYIRKDKKEGGKE